MKFRYAIASAVALAMCAGTTMAQDNSGSTFGVEMRLGGVAYKDDALDDAGGIIELGVTFWEANRNFGLWVGGGVEGAELQWFEDFKDGRDNHETDIYGGLLGASLLFRAEILPNVALRAEGGARYVFMDVDDDWDDDHHHHHHYHSRSEWREHEAACGLDIDDTVFAIATLQLEFDLNPLLLAVGGGYQFDLVKPDVSFWGEDFDELDLSGALFFVSAGVEF